MHASRFSKLEKITYTTTFVLTALFIFIADDKNAPITRFFQWQYWLPSTLYAGFVMMIIIGFSLLLKTFIRKRVLVLGLSISIGFLLGLKSLLVVTNWVF